MSFLPARPLGPAVRTRYHLTMSYNDLVVLIPSHSLEDFPTDLGDREAASLLNAFAAAWHPSLLASARALPRWQRADDPPELGPGRLVFVPMACDGWLPCGWVDRARSEGHAVVAAIHDRDEMIQAALAAFRPDAAETRPEGDAEPGTGEHDAVLAAPPLVADFLALGSCHLQVELLTRRMHHFSSFDEVFLQREAVAAADAALADDVEAARARLRGCFEVLTEARERFYPVDCYLIDLCLLVPRVANEDLERTLSLGKPLTLLAAAEDLEAIGAENPERIRALRAAWENGTAEVCGGEFHEGPLPLLPLGSVLWPFAHGQRVFRRLFGRVPTTWGRRRFGLSTLLPQVLRKFGCHSALHLAMDDGLYPDTEHSKVRWEGCDGTAIDALTRIPLAADSPSSYLRFSMRMSESMQEDQTAAVVFARWPEVTAPWFRDLERMHEYSPVLGRFVTLDQFFRNSDDPGRLASHTAAEYLTPFLFQAVAFQEPDPISRFADHVLRRHRFDAACWFQTLAGLLAGQPGDPDALASAERRIEEAGPDSAADREADAAGSAEAFLDEFAAGAARALAEVVMPRSGGRPGYLLLNPLSFSRTVAVELADAPHAPAVEGPVRAVQFDDARRAIVADVPGAGFTWIPADGGGAAPAAAGSRRAAAPTSEENLLRNEFFEVYINESTGGIGKIKGYGRSPNRLSQQLAFRFPQERLVQVGDGEDQVKTRYSEMRCRSSQVTCAGPALGEIVTTGDVVDQADGRPLAGFRQTVRVWRGRRVVEIDLELDLQTLPDGDPWNTYYAARFAWNDSTASLTRSVQQGAHGFHGERVESPHYFEIADDEQRTTILSLGLPFHRKTGPRMVDTILVVAGETRRRFRFVIALDESFPMQAALDAMVPPAVIPTPGGPPRVGNSGWFFHLDAPNVQVIGARPWSGGNGTAEEPAVESTGNGPPAVETAGLRHGLVLRLAETEGRQRRAKLRCYRPPSRARQLDFQGNTLHTLPVEGDAVSINVGPYEITDLELVL